LVVGKPGNRGLGEGSVARQTGVEDARRRLDRMAADAGDLRHGGVGETHVNHRGAPKIARLGALNDGLPGKGRERQRRAQGLDLASFRYPWRTQIASRPRRALQLCLTLEPVPLFLVDVLWKQAAWVNHPDELFPPPGRR
jgi:hypothetical protein